MPLGVDSLLTHGEMGKPPTSTDAPRETPTKWPSNSRKLLSPRLLAPETMSDLKITATVMVTNSHTEPTRFLQCENAPGTLFLSIQVRTAEPPLSTNEPKGDPIA